jgi:DNA-binding transcriptional regulator YiaG
LHVRVSVDGQRDYAHRIAYRQVNGEIPAGLVVMHTCDFPPCCNPDHLVAGTIAMNNAMRDERRRRTPHLPRGEKHWSAKLSARDVAAIRRGQARNISADHLAVMYAVSTATIRNVWSGRHYADTVGTHGAAA